MTHMGHAPQLLLRHQFMLMDFLHAVVRHAADADDLFQETALAIIEKPAEQVPAGDEDFRRWARQIAMNKALRRWRDQRRSRTVADDRMLAVLEQAYTEHDGDEPEDTARRQALVGCLGSLPAEGRGLLTAHYVDREAVERISARLQRSQEAIRMRLMRLRDRLRDCILRRLTQGCTDA